jgi:hypothetical protein
VSSRQRLPPTLWAALILILTPIPAPHIPTLPDRNFETMDILDWAADTTGAAIGVILALASEPRLVSA